VKKGDGELCRRNPLVNVKGGDRIISVPSNKQVRRRGLEKKNKGGELLEGVF